jgi:flagellar basal-body rod protein FlgG
LARIAEQRFERLVARSNEFVPILADDETCDHAPLISIDPPPPDEVMRALPDEPSRPRPLSIATYETAEEDCDPPADAMRTAQETRPLTRRQLEDQAAVREVIEQEMPEVSAEERDIWFEELKSIPAEAVRDLLKVRKQLRVLSPDHHLSGPAPLLSSHDPHDPIIAAEPVTQSLAAHPRGWAETQEALGQAVSWSTHNIANAATPGYKRIDVILGDLYDASREPGVRLPLGRGCGIRTWRVDARPGELEESGRELDVALEGEGWFVIREAEGEDPCYTRCGAWTITELGMLGMSAGDRSYIVDPSIAVPQPLSSIRIDVNGVVSIREQGEDEPVPLGQLSLARFVDPSRLIPLGHGVYAAPRDMTPIHGTPNTPGFGAVRQGFLEQSNVDLEREQSDCDRWRTILNALPSSEIPRTARPDARSPK